MGDHNGIWEKGEYKSSLLPPNHELHNFKLPFQIYAEDVNFFNYRNTSCLEAACETPQLHKPYPYAYPPKFVLEVSSRYAKHHSSIELTFTGAKRDLYTEIQLHPLRSELPVDTWSAVFKSVFNLLYVKTYRWARFKLSWISEWWWGLSWAIRFY